ncbi:hypothetical protein BU23DRAFT_564441 [Bimuria novae-zelandiae CBS 107.79]|uniref:Uncharacterized protein n=1 Tax=Bimuria novae-zelandiae CBS 107.79 TaxID=1447943 RepID=A0A6A5VLP8_9PLEO|nr:hypothetical protein BU23DRAFT_564441 [Bimuria novae-zelandiae CBS 107.79]
MAPHGEDAGATKIASLELVLRQSPEKDFLSFRNKSDPSGPTPYHEARRDGNVLRYLPRELRDIIYGYYIEIEGSKAIRNPEKDYEPAPLVRTSKQIACTFVTEDYASNGYEGLLVPCFGKIKRFIAFENVIKISVPSMSLFERARLNDRYTSFDWDQADAELRKYNFNELLGCKQLCSVHIHVDLSYESAESSAVNLSGKDFTTFAGLDLRSQDIHERLDPQV